MTAGRLSSRPVARSEGEGPDGQGPKLPQQLRSVRRSTPTSDAIRAAQGPVHLHVTRGDQPVAGVGFDWVVVALSAWFVVGAYLDGWAHLHVPHLESFFTPWHAVLYSGFLAVAGLLVVTVARNYASGYRGWRAMPAGYEQSLLGVAIFAVGGLSDMIWHLLFGIEADLEALLSPTHLVLALGAGLIVTGPLRSGWRRSETEVRTWAAGVPMLLALTLLLSLWTFFTQYVHPFGATLAATAYRPSTSYVIPVNLYLKDGQLLVASPAPGMPAARAGIFPGDRIVKIDGRSPDGMTAQEMGALLRGARGTVVRLSLIRAAQILEVAVPREVPIVDDIGFYRQALGVAGILLQTAFLMGVVLLAVRRWPLPPGSLTLIFGLNAALMTSMRDRFLSTGPYSLIAAAALGGLAGDLLLRQLRPSVTRPAAFRLFAFAVPSILYGWYFLALRLTGGGMWWSVHFWTGAIALAGVVGWLLSYLLILPRVPHTGQTRTQEPPAAHG